MAFEEGIDKILTAQHRSIGEVTHATPKHFPHRKRTSPLDLLLDLSTREACLRFHHSTIGGLAARVRFPTPKQ